MGDIETQGPEKIQIFVSFLVQAASTSRVVPLCAEEDNFDYIFYGTDWYNSLNRDEPSSYSHFLLSLTLLVLASYDNLLPILTSFRMIRNLSEHAYVSCLPVQRKVYILRILLSQYRILRRRHSRSTRRPSSKLFHGRYTCHILTVYYSHLCTPRPGLLQPGMDMPGRCFRHCQRFSD